MQLSFKHISIEKYFMGYFLWKVIIDLDNGLAPIWCQAIT